MAQVKKHGQKSNVSRRKHGNADSQTIAHVAIAHQGPLPMASEFAAYEHVLPGAADRIIAMAEEALKAEISNSRTNRMIELVSLVTGRLFLYHEFRTQLC